MDKPTLEQPILFISDVHLGGFTREENDRIETELIRLIDYSQNSNIRIAILGDFFDYWMEYPNHVPELGKKLLDRFESFNKKLGPSLYITGNHDNWTRDHLPQRGFYIHHNQYEFSINSQKIMALHGDGLNDSNQNLSRPLLHRFLRNDQFLKIYQTLLPPKIGIKTMKYFSRFTRFIDGKKDKTDKLNNWAKEQLANTGVDIILCGHDHMPRQKHFSFGTYINLGTFYQHQTMAFYNNDSISLVCWESEKRSLIPYWTDK
jgi:UDP-2,3-diacylglucosamine pyrophosphatase LpxH